MIKEFQTEFEFTTELEASQRCTEWGSRHRHLMKALFAFSHGDKHFIALPLAKGSLETFWQSGTALSQDPKFILQQCFLITDGLQNIHEYNDNRTDASHKIIMGRHGDIKPRNILWFENASTEENRLVLSDFTLVRFHLQGTNEETTLSDIGGTQTYRAPEKDVRPRRHVSPKYDVWSLGCVFLEIISCYLVGYVNTYAGCLSFQGIRKREDLKRWEVSEDKYFIWCREQAVDDKERFGAKVKGSVRDVSWQWPIYNLYEAYSLS